MQSMSRPHRCVSESIEGVVLVKPKKQSKHFNKTAFLKSLTPEEHALCHATVTEFKAGSPKIEGVKNLKSLDAELDAEKKDNLMQPRRPSPRHLHSPTLAGGEH